MAPTVVDVQVEGDGEGNLVVTWVQEGEGPVEVALGPTPDTIDHARPAAVAEGTGRIELTGLDRGRHYVSVAPAAGGSAVVAAERLVRFDGTLNFRDLGGYRTGDGHRTRWGLVFRSDALHRLTVEDVALAGRLGLRVVYDLRRDAEREREPSVDLPEVRRELLTMGGAVGKGEEILEQILSGQVERIGEEYLVEAYQTMIDRDAATFGRLLTGLADRSALPAVFHCSAGKDRTGASAALLLGLLGVDEASIIEDYELTSRFYTDRKVEEMRSRFARGGADIEDFRALFAAPRVALEGMLATIDRDHGGVERYLRERAGLSGETVAELRRLLLQPA